MPLSDKTIYGWVQSWVNDNKDKIVRMYMQKGGWEGWAQAELADYLQSLPGRPSIEREQHVYTGGREAVDLRITCHDGTVWIVELKCESLFASATTSTISRGNTSFALFEEDIHKLRRRRDVRHNAMAIMIAISPEAQSSMQSLVTAYDIEKETFNASDGWVIAVYKY